MAKNGRWPPSLTAEELRKIQEWERTRRSPVIRRLLWEVARLRGVALRANQFEEMMRSSGQISEFNSRNLIADALREQLDELPAIREQRDWKLDLLYPTDGKKRKGSGEG
jgi:hypothetical protein